VSSAQSAVPEWLLAAVDAPPRFADIAAMRARILAEPSRVLRNIVPEIDAHADSVGEDDAWKTNVVRLLYRTWLEHEPDIAKRTKNAAKAQADRAVAVEKAAMALLKALESARFGLSACRLEGIEPVLLAQGLDELDIQAAEPSISALLEAARNRSKLGGRNEGYASVATLTAKLDAASATMGFQLSVAGAADLFELASVSAKRTFTEEQIRKSRARTIR
jgi:hypothetical protein